MTTVVEYQTPCEACDEVHTQRFVVATGGEIPRPSFPFGWKSVGTAVFCPKHRLVLMVDGEAKQI